MNDLTANSFAEGRFPFFLFEVKILQCVWFIIYYTCKITWRSNSNIKPPCYHWFPQGAVLLVYCIDLGWHQGHEPWLSKVSLLSGVSSCCCDTIHTKWQLRWESVYLRLQLPVAVYHWGEVPWGGLSHYYSLPAEKNSQEAWMSWMESLLTANRTVPSRSEGIILYLQVVWVFKSKNHNCDKDRQAAPDICNKQVLFIETEK